MNEPVKKFINSENKKEYEGDLISKFPNRKQRRLPIQKSNRNPVFGVNCHTNSTKTDVGTTLLYKNFIQRVFNKKKNKFITILHTRYL